MRRGQETSRNLAKKGRCFILVLSRKKDEKIIINGNIVITVVEIRGDKARLGFEADKSVTIDRMEVHEAKKKAAAKEVTGAVC